MRGQENTRQDAWLQSLISKLFYLFFFATIFYILYTIFIPTAAQWEAVTNQMHGFPNNFNPTNFEKGVFRHLALWPESINVSFLINTINFTFLTIFIRHIQKSYKELNLPNGKIRLSVYVEWAMVALISGILYFSASINISDILYTLPNIVIITVFALVLYFVLHRFRIKLEDNERMEETKALQC